MLILKDNNKPPSPPTVEGAPQNKQKKTKKTGGLYTGYHEPLS